MGNALGFSPPCCCDDVCIVLALEQPEEITLEEGETLAWEILADTTGNSGTGTTSNSCGGSPSESVIGCCDDWHDTITNFATQFLPDPTTFGSSGCDVDCPPEELDYAGATCGYCFGGDAFGPCADADGGIEDFDFRETQVVFVKNPSDGHIWIGVNHHFEFQYSSPPRCGQGNANGWLDTGLTSLTYADFPFSVPLDGDCSDDSCWSTPGTTTIDINPIVIPAPP